MCVCVHARVLVDVYACMHGTLCKGNMHAHTRTIVHASASVCDRRGSTKPIKWCPVSLVHNRAHENFALRVRSFIT